MCSQICIILTIDWPLFLLKSIYKVVKMTVWYESDCWPWCQSCLTFVTIWRACDALLVTFTENQNHGGLCSSDWSSVEWWSRRRHHVVNNYDAYSITAMHGVMITNLTLKWVVPSDAAINPSLGFLQCTSLPILLVSSALKLHPKILSGILCRYVTLTTP